MKVSKCGGTVKAEPTLTWAEMIQNEGVYKPNNSSTDARLIVLRHKKDLAVLFTAHDNLEPAEGDWCSETFIRVNETVCFELKPA